ncbi:MAG: hypothetical protein M3R62_05965, partial [Acidobacteriota bacterium]|nr:hypothetical protein [Acidobacteriota bacterium]
GFARVPQPDDGSERNGFGSAWMSYDFIGAAALLAASAPATQLDPSTCNPLGVPLLAFPSGVNGPVNPVIPGGINGNSGSGPAGVGPNQNTPL